MQSLSTEIPPETKIYHGHGKPAEAQKLIGEQIAYIETVRSLVAEALKGDRKVNAPEQEQIVVQLEQQYTDYETSLVLPDLRIANIEGIAQELQQD